MDTSNPLDLKHYQRKQLDLVTRIQKQEQSIQDMDRSEPPFSFHQRWSVLRSLKNQLKWVNVSLERLSK